jgi:hypothetical protein
MFSLCETFDAFYSDLEGGKSHRFAVLKRGLLLPYRVALMSLALPWGFRRGTGLPDRVGDPALAKPLRTWYCVVPLLHKNRIWNAIQKEQQNNKIGIQ